MPDPPKVFAVPISEFTLDCQNRQLQRGACPSASIGSNQVRSLPRSPRRLPIPPIYASPSTSSSSIPSSSSSGLSLPTPPHPTPGRSYPVRPLPKMPNSVPALPENPKHRYHARIDEWSSHPTNSSTSTTSTIVPQPTVDIEGIRRGNLSKLRRHLGYSIPPDLIPPRLDRDEACPEEGCCDLPAAPMPPKCFLRLTASKSPIVEKTVDEMTIRRYSRRWLREKKGRRWVEDDYNIIIQSLRTLR